MGRQDREQAYGMRMITCLHLQQRPPDPVLPKINSGRMDPTSDKLRVINCAKSDQNSLPSHHMRYPPPYRMRDATFDGYEVEHGRNHVLCPLGEGRRRMVRVLIFGVFYVIGISHK